MLQSGSILFVGTDGKLHVGLAAGQPDLADHHIRKGDPVTTLTGNHKRQRAACREGGQGETEVVAEGSVISQGSDGFTAAEYLSGRTQEGGGDSLALRGVSEDPDGFLLLQNHMVCKDGSTLYPLHKKCCLPF